MLPDSPIPPSAAHDPEPVKLFGGIFLAAMLAGLAAALRSKQKLSWRTVASTMLNSGFIAVIVALLRYQSDKDASLFLLIGYSLLAGLGGGLTLTYLMRILRAALGLPADADSTEKKS